MPTYYEILGVDPWDKAEVIRDAYRALRDRYQNTDRKRYNKIMEAWSVLGDEQRRKDYHCNTLGLPLRPPARSRPPTHSKQTDLPVGRSGRSSSHRGDPWPASDGAITEVLSAPSIDVGETTRVHPPPASDGTVPHPPPLRIGQIVIKVQSELDKTVELGLQEINIGRDERQCGIHLPDPHMFISRKHASITYENGRYYVQDAHSTNGTRLQGQALTPDQKVLLNDGDAIEIEGRLLIFRWKPVLAGEGG